MWCNWCVLCRRIKRESTLSLREPRTLSGSIFQRIIAIFQILTSAHTLFCLACQTFILTAMRTAAAEHTELIFSSRSLSSLTVLSNTERSLFNNQIELLNKGIQIHKYYNDCSHIISNNPLSYSCNVHCVQNECYFFFNYIIKYLFVKNISSSKV